MQRTAITLDEFLFTLNQDEDCRVTLVDFNAPIGEEICTEWKSSFLVKGSEANMMYDMRYANWYVQNFILTQGGVEICITKELED